MTAFQKGMVLATVQLALVASLGAKYALDRARLPRVWAQTVAYDPDLPIRGRYVSLRVRVAADNVYGESELQPNARSGGDSRDIALSAIQGHLVANPAQHPTGLQIFRWRTRAGEDIAALSQPVAFFLPEHAKDPARLQPAEELWIEVTVPKSGPPRPIRLAVKHGETFTPLEIK
jgi:hypothetical protein